MAKTLEERREEIRLEQERMIEQDFYNSFDNKKFNDLSIKQQTYLYQQDRDLFIFFKENKDLAIGCYMGVVMTYQEKENKLEKEYQEKRNKHILEQSKREAEEAKINRMTCQLDREALGVSYDDIDKRIDMLVELSLKNLFGGK